MYSTQILILALLGLQSANSCKPFSNSKATIYTGSADDPQKVSLKDNLELMKEAYRIEITDQDIGALCAGAFKDFKYLDTLVIKDSNVEELEPGVFEDVPKLRIVDLSGNSIKIIPSGVFNNLDVRRVNLTYNKIYKIDSDAFDSMKQLQVVELENNHIKKIDTEWFKDSPKVYRVELRYNNIKELPKDAFKNLANSKTRTLALDIWLNNNEITDVHPQAFKNVDKVQHLWLSDNKISSLNELTFAGIQIHNLQVDNNKLHCLGDKFLSNIDVRELNVDGNPMECDCLRNIRKWGKKKGVEVQSARRSFSCMRDKIEDVMNAQKNYYEEKIIENKF